MNRPNCHAIKHSADAIGNKAAFPTFTVQFQLTSIQIESLRNALGDAYNLSKGDDIAGDLLFALNNALDNQVIK
jgi:hypothetical protein